MHKINKDTINFTCYFDNNYFEGIELVYEGNEFEYNKHKPNILIITGTSGVGKDTLVDYVIDNLDHIKQVKTATTRKRRYELSTDAPVNNEELNKLGEEERSKLLNKLEKEGFVTREPISKYVWMREKKEEESCDQYTKNMIREYDLVEHDYHYGNLYGVPRKSVEDVVAEGNTPLFRVDVSGAINLHNIFSSEYNVLIITVLPDKIEEASNRVLKRTSLKGDANECSDIRNEVILEEYSKFTLITNFYLRNTTISKGSMLGLERSFKAIKKLLEFLNY